MNAAALRKLKHQLQLIQEAAGGDTTIGQILVLVEVALHPGELITHLTENVQGDYTHTMVSKTIDTLGAHQRKNSQREPAGLVERRDVEGDRRARGVFLTKKGERLFEGL